MEPSIFLPSFGKTPNKRSSIYFSILCLVIFTQWNTFSVSAAPAKLDLQPPIFEATASATALSPSLLGNGDFTTIDSYGNPIESLQPIETPDGRKVVSAQGVQFEIPNYASGITELRKPADDLLPPFVDKIGSISEEVAKKQRNPFLPTPTNGKYRQNQTTRRFPTSTTTTTTTTTTTPTPSVVEENPFKPTIPPWLTDFDYTDLAPGVPFVYDPNEDESPVDKDILPPSKIKAPFETAAANDSFASTTSNGDQKKIPLSADRESFPPFNNVLTGSSSLPSKTTFTKSEDGKVITNNIFLSGSIGSTSAKPFGFTQSLNSQEKNPFTTPSFSGSNGRTSAASSVFKQFGSSSAAASEFVTTSGTTSTSGGSKYTGSFGGPVGVLAPQVSVVNTASATATKTYNKPTITTFEATSAPESATNNKDKFSGSFGGPPGILKPYDNVKNR